MMKRSKNKYKGINFVSDKGGELVVMNKHSQCELTEHYLQTTSGVYKYIEPTRKYQGAYRQIHNPTVVSFKRQIKSLTERLQTKSNQLWRAICNRRNLNDSIIRAFLSSHTQLPAMYILLKTHKFDVNSLDINSVCKVRPIVSCVSSPTEKLAWLCTHIFTPLLEFIPSHLNNIFQHLDHLSQLTPEQLADKQFCSGDISSLYTNINIQSCIDDIIALLDENKVHINFYGLKLIDIQEMLECVLGDAFFHLQFTCFSTVSRFIYGMQTQPDLCHCKNIFLRTPKYIYGHYLHINTVRQIYR